ncbi:MAG: hypothetical protein ACRCS8_04095 [Brevinema sp.]
MKKNLLLFLLLSSCKVLPDNYADKLIGSWENETTIDLAGTTATYTMIFDANNGVEIEIIEPSSSLTTNFTYKVGTIKSFPAFSFFDDGKEVAFPNFFEFEDNDKTLITSTNFGMKYPKKWTKK